MSFERVAGHEAPLRVLRGVVASGRVGSGYLFFGPAGVGKSLVAHEFARSILCRGERPSGEACEACPACVRSASGAHRALLTVGLEEGRTRLLLAQVHELAERLSLRPLEGDRQVAVLEDVELANEESMNALLKTLEEPPPGATLVLVTANREIVPETIRSRCQGVRFGPLPAATVRSVLTALGEVGEDEAGALADLAGGSPGRALRLRRLGYPALATRSRELLARAAAEGLDPVGVARDLASLLADAGERAGRAEQVRESLLILMDRFRVACLAGGGDAGAVSQADEGLTVLAKGLADLGLNVGPEAVLRSCLVRVLPLLRGGAGGAAERGSG